ncbi:hypothetical protein U9M48_030180 [Paspalum notatum var. saurae]|uniref:Membrane protein of ER body-like protein n=1 Tax=Paspalum notatum var. saurae TaxID=547442 RepID=A0AAQ3U4F4_PASNO
MMEVERPREVNDDVLMPALPQQQVVVMAEEEEEEEQEHSSSTLLHTRETKKNSRSKMLQEAEGQRGLGMIIVGDGDEEEQGRPGTGSNNNSIFFDATKGLWKCRHCDWTHRLLSGRPGTDDDILNHQLGRRPENQVVTQAGGQKDNSSETSVAQAREIEEQDNHSAQETNHHSSNGKLENGSHSNGVHEISSSSEAVAVADGLKLITAIRDGKSILPNWSCDLDISNGSASTTQVHEIEVDKDEKSTDEGKVDIEEYDLEKILDEQETHDLYCPNCKSCITRRVILKKRKRTVRPAPREEPVKKPHIGEPSATVPSQTADEDSPDVFRCLSCFTFFIPTGCGFNIFRIFERRDVNQQVQVQHPSASQQTSENCGSWLLSCFQTVDSPKQSNAADSLKQPLLSGGSQSSKTPVEYSTSSSHSNATIGQAEQLKKPSPTGLQTTTNTSSSESHVATSSSVTVQTSSSSWQSNTGFIQTDERHMVTVQQDGSWQEEIPPPRPAGENLTDTIQPGRKADIQENMTSASDNSTFSRQPIFNPELKFPTQVSPGVGNLTDNKPASVTPEPVEPEAPAHVVVPVPDAETPVTAPSAQRDEWDILKAIVYGGLVESITSLSVVSAAAASGAKTLDIFILGIANLIGGLPLIYHNTMNDTSDFPFHKQIADLRSSGDVAESSEQVGHYWLELGRRSKYQLHMVIAILSYILFGLLPPVVYGLSFRTSDNRENKMMVVAAASLLCIALLAIGKAHVKRPRTYITTLLYYLSIGFSCSGLSYVAGILVTKLLAHFGLIDQGGASAPAPPGLSFPEAAAWASY